MEETSRGRQPLLKIVREFAGSRLEHQILVRTYQLAVPILHKRTNAAPSPEPFPQPADDSFQSQPLAKGA
jgi:hypothetical protein